MNDREKLIEEAAKAMADGEHNVLGWRGHSEDERDWYLKDAAIALAVFEKAHTPTDDEREALRIAHLDARQTAYREDLALWFRDYDNSPEIAANAFFRGWDAAVAGGFRRSKPSQIHLTLTEDQLDGILDALEYVQADRLIEALHAAGATR